MYRVSFFKEGMLVAIPGRELRFVPDESRPYVHSMNLRIDIDCIIYITDDGVGQSNLPLASQLQQDKYAWVMKSDHKIDQGMPWSNAIAYGVAHNLIPWVKPDLGFLICNSGVTLSHIELWAHYGDCLIKSFDVIELFDETTQKNLHSLRCEEDMDAPACMRKLNFH